MRKRDRSGVKIAIALGAGLALALLFPVRFLLAITAIIIVVLGILLLKC